MTGDTALLSEAEGSAKQKFKVYPIGYFHIDIADVRTEEGKLHLYVGIDRTSKFAFVQLHEKADRPTAIAFLKALLDAVPYDLHTILTDNGIQFADITRDKLGREQAQKLKAVLDAIGTVLASDATLPDKVAGPDKRDRVRNPF